MTNEVIDYWKGLDIFTMYPSKDSVKKDLAKRMIVNEEERTDPALNPPLMSMASKGSFTKHDFKKGYFQNGKGIFILDVEEGLMKKEHKYLGPYPWTSKGNYSGLKEIAQNSLK